MKPSFWEMRRLIRESSLSTQMKWLLTVLADYAGESEWSHPSQTTLARDLTTSKRHVIRLLKQATKQKYIESRRRRRQTNQYRICWKKIGDLSVTSSPVLEVTPESPIGDTQVTGG